MAKTYYGYKKRDGLQAVDYLGAAKDLTEGLTDIFDEREKERGLIEEEIREAEKQTKDVPMGDSGTLNQFALEGSNNAAEALRTQTYLLRNSKIRPSEFTKFRQNVMDGMMDLKEGAVSLNKNISETAAAVEAGTASVAQAKFLEDAMQDTWFDRTRMYTDTKSGQMMIVRTDENGEDIKGSENSVRNFKNQTKQTIARYDIEKETSSFTKTLGEDIRLSMRGDVKTVKDALGKTTIDPDTKKEYTGFQLVDEWVNAATDSQLASILVDELGGKYKATGDVNDEGKKGMVYYEADPTAVNKNSRAAKLTDGQKDAAREYLRRNIYSQIDYKETPAATTGGKAPSSAQIARGRRIDIDKERVNDWLKFYTGDDATKERILSANAETIAENIGAGSRPIDINVVGDKVSVSYEKEYDDETKTITTDITIPQDDFTGFLSTSGRKLLGDDFIEYMDEALDASNYKGTERYNPLNVSYKTQVEVEKSKKQGLDDWTGVLPLIPKMDKFYGTFSGKQEDATKKVDSFIQNSSIKGVDSKLVDNNIKIGLDGIYISVPLNVKASTIQENITSALKKIYDAAVEGKPLVGTDDPNPDPTNPAGDGILGT